VLFLGLLLCIFQVRSQSSDTTIVLTKEDAKGTTNAWSWQAIRQYDLAASENLKLTINTADLTGTKQNGDVVTLGDHYQFELLVEDPQGYSADAELRVAGGFAPCTDKTDCAYTNYVCNPSKGVDEATIVNGATAQTVKVTINIKGNDDGQCGVINEFVEGWATWVKTLVIISIVSLVLCILCVVLVCCGVVKCCCGQQNNQVVVETAKY